MRTQYKCVPNCDRHTPGHTNLGPCTPVLDYLYEYNVLSNTSVLNSDLLNRTWYLRTHAQLCRIIFLYMWLRCIKQYTWHLKTPSSSVSGVRQVYTCVGLSMWTREYSVLFVTQTTHMWHLKTPSSSVSGVGQAHTCYKLSMCLWQYSVC